MPPPIDATYRFLGIYPFTENELWLTAESYIYGHVTIGPNADGELAPAAHLYHPDAPDIGDAFARDSQGRIWAIDRRGLLRFTRPDKEPPTTVREDQTLSAYPNPSCCQVHLRWISTDNSPAQLQLFDTQGQLVYDLVKQDGHLGPQQVIVPRRELPAGLYLAVLYQGSRTETVKIIFE